MEFTGQQHFREMLIEIADAFLVVRDVISGFLGNVADAEYIHRYTITDRFFRSGQNVVDSAETIWIVDYVCGRNCPA